jgi:hypothetical protein|tara:strand:- start:888 stop:1235 length:348 start_codon:yes stop_codon:yes gene_type:complete
MIEANERTNGTVVKQETPAKITTSMIITDLDNGINREGIQEKYGLEKWMVTQIFQDPRLKGRKAKKVRKLPFEFIDDVIDEIDPNQTSIPIEEDTVANVDFDGEADFEEINELNN